MRILTHLHGGLLTGESDGNPYATPDAYASGQTQTATYPNAGVNADGTPYLHPASLLWYHDHLLGDTRMNMVAGLAGAYLLRDSFDTGTNPLLPGPINVYELPLVVQDRRFNTDGSLLYPVAPRRPVSTPAPSLTTVMRITVKPTASPGAPMSVPTQGSLPYPPVLNALTDLTKPGPPAETADWELNLNAHPTGIPMTPPR